MRGQRKAGFAWRLTAGQAGSHLTGQRCELGTVAGAGRADDKGALPVHDEVLAGGRGVQAGHLADRVWVQAAQPAAGKVADPFPRGGADDAVAAIAGGDRAAAVLPHLDGAGYLTVPAGREPVHGHLVVVDKCWPRPGRGPLGQVEGLHLGNAQRRQPDELADQRFGPGAHGHDHRRGAPGPVGGVHHRVPLPRIDRTAGDP
jgi:hypothetical protein